MFLWLVFNRKFLCVTEFMSNSREAAALLFSTKNEALNRGTETGVCFKGLARACQLPVWFLFPFLSCFFLRCPGTCCFLLKLARGCERSSSASYPVLGGPFVFHHLDPSESAHRLWVMQGGGCLGWVWRARKPVDACGWHQRNKASNFSLISRLGSFCCCCDYRVKRPLI